MSVRVVPKKDSASIIGGGRWWYGGGICEPSVDSQARSLCVYAASQQANTCEQSCVVDGNESSSTSARVLCTPSTHAAWMPSRCLGGSVPTGGELVSHPHTSINYDSPSHRSLAGATILGLLGGSQYEY